MEDRRDLRRERSCSFIRPEAVRALGIDGLVTPEIRNGLMNARTAEATWDALQMKLPHDRFAWSEEKQKFEPAPPRAREYGEDR